MLWQIYQHSRAELEGPTFFDLLAQFRREPVAVLYSGHEQGESVIARQPLITFSAADEASRPHIQCHPDLNQWCHNVPGPLIDRWHWMMHDVHFGDHVSPLSGWIGQIGYDIGRLIEKIPAKAKDDLKWPLLHWRYFDEYYIFNHASRRWTIVTAHWGERADPLEARLDRMEASLKTTPAQDAWRRGLASTILESMPREDYLRNVVRIKEYIAAGDIYQANFAQRWKAQVFAEPVDVFRALMDHSPSPFSSLLVFDNRAAISASPELFVQKSGSHVITKPIKGTRARVPQDDQKDMAARDELWNSEKDKAELAMIVDLLRNDLGRIAQYGTVKVTEPRAVEQHPTVWHTVAAIEADVEREKNWSDLIRALCPGGSITGAPKIRAMQIIEELEPYRRGLYCGNIGCISRVLGEKSGNFHPIVESGMLNIAIRTIQMIDNTAYIYAGGGIVADSDPQKEYEECLHKAAALFKALNLKIN